MEDSAAGTGNNGYEEEDDEHEDEESRHCVRVCVCG